MIANVMLLGYELWGNRMQYDFPGLKLPGFLARWDDLEQGANPFAVVIMAHLMTQQTRGDNDSRCVWKRRLAKLLHERGFSRDDVMSKVILETDRLLLREITQDDADDLLEIWADPEAMRFFPKTLDREEMSAWIERNLKRYEQYGHGPWAVILKSDRLFAGDCGLVMQEVDGTEELEVGYHFKRRYWGMGLATEAARLHALRIQPVGAATNHLDDSS